MEPLGAVGTDGSWEFQYSRCRVCGFALRTILRAIPNTALIRDLRDILKNSFQRNVPDL